MIRKREMRNVAVLSVLVLFMLPVCFGAAPVVGAIYYVSTDGDDTSAGTSPKLAWRTITHAATKAQAGDLVRIKGGDYGAEHVVVANSGTAEAPIRFEGYDGKVRLEGKVEKVKGKMKLNGYGVLILGKAHIKVSGITAIKYGMAIMVRNGSHHVTVENCTAGFGGNAAISVIRSHHCQVRRCTAYNVGMCNIQAYDSHDVTIADCWSYLDPRLMGIFPGLDTGTDYLYGASCGRNVHFTRCRGDGKNRSGHAMCFTATNIDKTAPDSFRCTNCLVTDCEMYNCWEHFGVRHGSHDITFVNCYAEGGREQPKGGDIGFYYRSGAYNIVVKNCRAKRLTVGLHAYETGGGTMKKCGVTRNITFENCIATHCTTGIRLNAPNSRAINCLSARNDYGVEICRTGPDVLAACKASGLPMEKIVKGCIVCENKVGIRGSAFPVTHCNVWDNETNFSEGAKPGEKCISKDPQFVEATRQPGRTQNSPDYGDWHLKETSPCKDMGPYAADPKASIGMR